MRSASAALHAACVSSLSWVPQFGSALPIIATGGRSARNGTARMGDRDA
jgi:hypothetical protein